MSAASGIKKAALTGDRLATLEAMRNKLAGAMDRAAPAVVAQIAGRLSAVLAEIESLKATSKKESPLDEITARRAARLAAADDDAPARRPTRQRRPRSG